MNLTSALVAFSKLTGALVIVVLRSLGATLPELDAGAGAVDALGPGGSTVTQK